jgi:NAD(P)H dehydrogenase (quinone)
MAIMVVLGHPNGESFNYAIAQAAASVLKDNGHEVWFHDLYAEGFEPLLTGAELRDEAVHGELARRHCDELRQAEGIIIVHPNWWGQPPAILKGWIDRVFRHGVAYQFNEGDTGGGVPRGLLKARKAIVFNTSNTYGERESRVFGDPLETLWKNCIFKFCGVPNFQRRMFRVIADSTPEQRGKWLGEVREMVEHSFPKSDE